ncbi:orange carotenoid protein [Microcoleus sp. FACHB-1515]|uniref:orange carotenoid protein N-terminal domain-containing protein n=1 Tax=Cyanophyceae TaxID=3028117 RepID=UPI0016873DC1|nr:orange carotenoid protein N-terminal domain-containing protein [Microcoleus sp. FACHB-1515]MBD2090554.1 orange carotenoid protein [Microcoleus sp. FACHB-1515]
MKADNMSAMPDETKQATEAFKKLGTDDKLALFYLIYKKMGDSVTPAAPSATDPELTPLLMGQFFELSDDEQLAGMRAIVNKEDTELSRAYGALKENNQLMVWYAWAQAMGDTVVGMPGDYQATDTINNALKQIEGLEFQEQITMLREVARDMGYSEVQPIPTQAETGKTPSL